MTTTWTDEQSAAALAEGWDIFECFGSDVGDWQIQRLDEADAFSGDAAAWRHVSESAERGSALHAHALAFIAEHNPIEATTIRLHVANHQEMTS